MEARITLTVELGVVPSDTVLPKWQLGRMLFPLGLVFFAVGISSAVAGPFLSLFLTTAVHASAFKVSAFLVASSSASLVATTLIGRLSDRHPIRRTVLIVAALSGLVSMSMNAFVRDYWLLLVSTATANALAMCLYPQTFAYGHQVLTANAPHRLAIGISTLRTVFSAAWVAGPSLGAFLLGPQGNHFTYVYAMSTGMYALAALVAIFRLREVGTLGKRSAQVAKPDVHKAAEPAVSTAAGPGARDAAEPAASPVTAAPEVPWSTLLLTAAGFTLLQAPMTLAVQALSLFLRDDLGVSVRDAGVVLGTCAALEVPLMLGLGTLASRIPLRILVLAGSVCGVVYYTAVALASSTWMLIGAQVFNATFIASVSGLGISYMQAMRPAHPGQATTLFTNTFPIGALLAGPLFGVARVYGMRLAYVMAACLCALGVLVLLGIKPKRQPARRPGPRSPRPSGAGAMSHSVVGAPEQGAAGPHATDQSATDQGGTGQGVAVPAGVPEIAVPAGGRGTPCECDRDAASPARAQVAGGRRGDRLARRGGVVAGRRAVAHAVARRTAR